MESIQINKKELENEFLQFKDIYLNADHDGRIIIRTVVGAFEMLGLLNRSDSNANNKDISTNSAA